MTALDDALNSSAIELGPHQLRANWRESDRSADDAINKDSPVLLTDQSDGTYTVSHALNDALPDAVTFTGDGDASGTLKAGLLGRDGLVYGTSGNRAYNGAGGSWDTGSAVTLVTAPIPPGTLRDDFILSCVLIDDSTAALAPQITDPKDGWDYLGVVSDAPLSMYVYCKRRWRSGHPQLTLIADKAIDFVSLSISFWGRNPQDMALDYIVSDMQLVAEASSTTTHSVASSLKNKGYQVAFWGSASGAAITPTAPMVDHGSPSGSGLVIDGAIRPYGDSGNYIAQATQTPATAIMCKAAISIEPFERPRWNAQTYFSPFNKDSPVYGWDRDTADVTMDARVLTEDGPVDTRLFTGQMQGLETNGDRGDMGGVSKTRISLNRSVSLPMVSGSRENLLHDWLVTYLMARGGSFIGPAPNKYTRYWAPLYGSTHAHWEAPQTYNASYYQDTTNPMLLFGNRWPRTVQGRWGPGMWGQQTSTRMEEVTQVPRNMWDMSKDDFPHLYDNGAGGPVMADMMSLSNTKGRIQFWVRGDAVQSAPTYLSASDDHIVKMTMTKSFGGNLVYFLECGIASNSRNPYIRMGTTAAGTLSTSFVFAGLPTDGQWHHVGLWWDFAAGTGNGTLDGSVITSSGWSSGGYNDISGLPATDAAGRAGGWTETLTIRSHVPASDFLLDFGEAYVAGKWAEHYPTPLAPGANAVYLPTYVPMQAIAEPTAVNAWDTLNDLCRSVIAAYRCDENDVFNFMPLEFFGRSPYMTPQAVQDTTKNASELNLAIDTSKIRNVVTVQFPDTRVDSTPQFVLQYTSSTDIPKGVSEITFPVDVPTVEYHGQAGQTGSTWDIMNLTSSQITTPNLPKTNHYITANTSADGTGTVLPAASVTAKIVAWDAGSVTLQFKNMTGKTAFLANNGDQVPFLQIMGYAARANDAYTTQRDPASVALRRERALETELPWMQTRTQAEIFALHLLNILSRANPTVTVNVLGDPRREPGQLVTVTDKEGTRVDGTWRILSIEHEFDGPKYTQKMLLRWWGPIQVWDDPTTPWDFSVWGV